MTLYNRGVWLWELILVDKVRELVSGGTSGVFLFACFLDKNLKQIHHPITHDLTFKAK